MKRWLGFVVVLALGAFVAVSAEKAAEKPSVEKAKGEKGQITGQIVKKDGAIITVKNEKETLKLYPYWRGGMPADGGGFEKDMVRTIEKLKVGDKVTVRWTMEEHARIDAIEKVGE